MSQNQFPVVVIVIHHACFHGHRAPDLVLNQYQPLLYLPLGNTILLTATSWMWLRLCSSMQSLLVVLCLQISIIKTATSIITAANENHFARAYFDC